MGSQHSKKVKKNGPLFPDTLKIVKGVFPRIYEEAVLHLIQSSNMVELIEVDSRDELRDVEKDEQRHLIEQELSNLKNVSNILHARDKPITYDDAPLEIHSLDELIQESQKLFEEGNIGKTVLDTHENINKMKNRINELNRLLDLRKTFMKLSLPLDALKPGPRTKIFVGFVFATRVNGLIWELEETTDGRVFTHTKLTEDGNALLFVLALKKDEDIVFKTLRQSNFQPIEIPVDFNIGELDEVTILNELSELEESITALEEHLNEQVQHTQKIDALIEALEGYRHQINLLQKMRRTRTTLVFWGWIEKGSMGEFENSFNKVTEGSGNMTFIDPPYDINDTPTPMKDKGFFEPFNDLVKVFGVPSHKEINPYIFTLILFPVFFGIMFADVLHGSILLIISLIAYRNKKTRKKPAEGLMGYLINGSPVLILSSISAMIFGFLFGSFGGDEVMIRHFLGDTFIAPYVEPVWNFVAPEVHGAVERNYLNFLILSLGVGAVTLLLGVGLRIYEESFNHHKTNLYVQILLFTFYLTAVVGVSIAIAVTDLVIVGYALLIISAIAVVSMFILEYKHGKIEGALTSVDHVLSLLSNTFSFSRLLAMNTVHAVLAILPLIFIEKFTPSIEEGTVLVHYINEWHFSIPWLIGIIIGALIVVPVEGIFSSLQALRLTWVEFFTKFYEGSGIEFKPDGFQWKLVKLIPQKKPIEALVSS